MARKISLNSALPVLAVLSAYTLLSFTLSSLGFLHPVEPLKVVGNLGLLKEFSMHAIFGLIVGVFTFDIRYATYAMLFPVLLDADHLLSVLGFSTYPRMSHSITFMLLSAFLVGKIFGKKGFNIKLFAIAAVALSSHIAFDAFDQNPTSIALFAPFSFYEIPFPVWASPVLELLGIAIVLAVFRPKFLSYLKLRKPQSGGFL